MNTQTNTSKTAKSTKATPPNGRRDFDRENKVGRAEHIKLRLDQIKKREGFNPRNLQKPATLEKIASLKAAYMAGEYVRPIEVAFAKTHYEIIDGECRFTAATQADAELKLRDGKGIDFLEALPLNDIDEADRLVLTINGNQGERLTPLEMAEVVERLRKEPFKLEREEIATRLHKTVGWIDRLIVLTKIPMEIREFVFTDRISMDVVVKIFQNFKDKKDEASAYVTEMVAHFETRFLAAQSVAGDDTTDVNSIGSKITMRDYMEFDAFKRGGRRSDDRDGDKPKGKDKSGGDGEGEGEGGGGKGKGDTPPKVNKKDEQIGLARELAFALPDLNNPPKSKIKATDEFTLKISGKAMKLLVAIVEEFTDDPDEIKGKGGSGKGKAEAKTSAPTKTETKESIAAKGARKAAANKPVKGKPKAAAKPKAKAAQFIRRRAQVEHRA